MQAPKIKIQLLKGGQHPYYASEEAACADLTACILDGGVEGKITLVPGGKALIPTGIKMEIPKGWCALIYPRSGMGYRMEVGMPHSVGVIDSDYRGEIMVPLKNNSNSVVTINHGDRIAQMMIAPAPQALFTVVESLSETERGEGGFGHTGR